LKGPLRPWTRVFAVVDVARTVEGSDPMADLILVAVRTRVPPPIWQDGLES
jgi:hypothetical protein